jgi:nicotinamide mononucleotide adenylyltransferase
MGRTALIFGRFQPLSLAHYRMIKAAIKSYKEVFVLPVQGQKAFISDLKTEEGQAKDLERKISRNPFDVEIRISLIESCFPNLNKSFIKKVDSASIEDFIKSQEKKFEKIDVVCGPDELTDYRRQLLNMKSKEEFSNLDIKVRLYDEYTRGFISGTLLRKSIIENDIASFSKMIAPPLAKEEIFNKLKNAIEEKKKIIPIVEKKEEPVKKEPTKKKTVKKETTKKEPTKKKTTKGDKNESDK